MNSVMMEAPISRKNYWQVHELVSIGVFAAVLKALTLLVAFMGGGLNPVTLILKNLIYTVLLIVLLHKVPKTGTLLVATMVTALISLLLMGQGVLNLPVVIASCIVVEALMYVFGGYSKTRNIVLGVLASELMTKAGSIFVSYLGLREQPGMIVMVIMLVAIGTIGTFLGLFVGVRFMKELRYAGIITH